MKVKLLRESKILQTVHRLAQKRGQEVYLVGGAVRDLLRKRPVGKDLDFVTPGAIRGLAKDLATEMKGPAFSLNDSFGTWRVIIRKGKKKSEVDISPMQGASIFDDLRRRDFTVNSLAVDLREIFSSRPLVVIDPMQGVKDLRQRVLRVNSEESLRQDPLRMLRAYRLASTLRWKLEAHTLRMIERNKDLIRQAAGERIRRELFAALNEIKAGRFLRALHQAGLLKEIFPEIAGWEGLDQGNHHDFPLLEHAIRTVEAGEFIMAHFPDLYPAFARVLEHDFSNIVEEGITRGGLFKFVAFFHDSGKPGTISYQAEESGVRFLDHEQEGQRINAIIARRMKLSRKSLQIIYELTRQHMRLLSLSQTKEVTPRAKYRFFRDLGKEGVEAVFLALADRLAARRLSLRWPLAQDLPEDLRRIKEVAGELLRYYFEEFSRKPPKPLLDGREIMKVLGLPQSKEVGILLAQLREAEISGRVQTKQEALEFLKNIDIPNLFS